MGKVNCLSINQCELFFNSSDHRPAHFHVKNDQEAWEIRVYIETTTDSSLDYDFKIPKKRIERIKTSTEKELRNKVVANREALLKEWSIKVCGE